MEILKGGLNVSVEILGNFAPIIVYWLYSGTYVMLGSVQNYRLHTKKEESEKNLVSKTDVVKGVLLQQAVQAVVATMLFVHLKRFNHPRVSSSLRASLFYSSLVLGWLGHEGIFNSLGPFEWVMDAPCVIIYEYIWHQGGTCSYWKRLARPQPASLIVLAREFFVAMVVLDTWQYFMHRYMHHNKFLYRQSILNITGLLPHTPLELYTTTPWRGLF